MKIQETESSETTVDHVPNATPKEPDMTKVATANPDINAASGEAPILAAGRALYDALGSGDGAPLERLLAENFQGN